MFGWKKKRKEKSNLDMGVAKELFFCARKKNGFGEKGSRYAVIFPLVTIRAQFQLKMHRLLQ